jgi:hypothetical protein
MEPTTSRPNERLLTSDPRNDVAVGAFLGFLSSLFLFTAAFELAQRMAPRPSGELPAQLAEHKILIQMWWELLFYLAVIGGEICAFRWLRARVPPLGRGYGVGCILVIVVFGSLWLSVFCQYLFAR